MPSTPPSPPALFFSHDTAPTEIYTLSLHDALPISREAAFCPTCAARSRTSSPRPGRTRSGRSARRSSTRRSEEHTSELQSLRHLVCRLLLEKKKKNTRQHDHKQRSTAHACTEHQLT